MNDRKFRGGGGGGGGVEDGLLTSRTSTGRSQILNTTNGSGFTSTRGSITNR